MPTTPTTIVVPTVGRPSLDRLLRSIADCRGPQPEAVVVVDDRPEPEQELTVTVDLPGLTVLRSGGAGPARARNRGWQVARSPWVSFVDDDVLVEDDWLDRLAVDLTSAASDVDGVQGRVHVPLPTGRRPTDFERSTAGLATARWITADLSYRRSALERVQGFDERFPRAYREDADLALRVQDTGGRLVMGTRGIVHPVRPEDDRVSLRQQRGNADDALMRAAHGTDWRDRAGAPRGRLRRHLAISAAASLALGATAVGRRRTAALAAACWLAGTADFAWARIAPGPRDRAEVRRMVRTSAAVPIAATYWAAVGAVRHRGADRWPGPVELVLFDRDGTLVHDVPYNGDPSLVDPVDDAAEAVALLRSAGLRTGVVTNQSAVGSGLITEAEMHAVNRRVDELLGPFDVWQSCFHGRTDGCDCRKPRPAMVQRACAELGVHPVRCVVIGDIGADLDAASSAGARGILVPTKATQTSEVDAAVHVEPTLLAAARAVLAAGLRSGSRAPAAGADLDRDPDRMGNQTGVAPSGGTRR